jgi:hypothetical protein
MGTIKYFWKCAVRSARGGKFNYRAWNQLYMVICLNIVSLLSTGCFIDNLD